MKKMNGLFLLAAVLALTVGCGKAGYKKTTSGLVYKLIRGNSKDSLLKDGQVAKIDMTVKLNDSLMFSTKGRVARYFKIQQTPSRYNIFEVLPLMRTGDSAICILMADSLMKLGEQLPPNAKKGDRFIIGMKVLGFFTSDSLAQADYNIAMEKDRPMQMKEQEEQMAKMKQQMKERADKELAELDKSGEKAKQDKVVQDYLAAKKINAQKAGVGTYVEIKTQGSGPLAADGKFVTVEYKGRMMRNDSSFESGTYPLQLGQGQVIAGWEEGLKLFSKGGTGTIYIPGYRAYGKNPQPGSPFRQDEALIFDVVIKDITDTLPPQEPVQPMRKKNN